LVAGIPNEALMWIALGMIGAAAAWRELVDDADHVTGVP
jgi:hypothetical protein